MLTPLYKFADLLRHRARLRRMPADHALGRRGEDIAHRFLQRAGIVIVERNYRMASGAGEVDLVGWEGDRLVFVEVKCRVTDAYGAPDRAIGPEKQRSLIRAARDLDPRQTENIGEALRASGVPALVLWGERDEFLSIDAVGRPLAELLGARLVKLPGAHFTPLDCPAEVAMELCNFLGRFCSEP